LLKTGQNSFEKKKTNLRIFKSEKIFLALHDRKFPVPKPLDVCRHTVVMGLIDGLTLCHVQEVADVSAIKFISLLLIW